MNAAIAQLGERQTEDLKVPGSIPGHGNKSKLKVLKILIILKLSKGKVFIENYN